MAPANTIPAIDLSPLRRGSEGDKREVSRAIDAALTEIGFFIVTGHGVSQDLIMVAREQAIDFFALPEEEKMKVQRPPAKISRGYNWVGDRSIAYSMGQTAPPDIQEAFAFGPESVPDIPSHLDGPGAKMYAPNIWPERPPEFKKVMLAYYRAMSDLARQVLGAMATALGVSEAYFSDKFDRQASVVRVIRYPAVTRPPLPGQLRAGTHTDYGSMTFVRGDDTAGRAAGQTPAGRMGGRPYSVRRVLLQHRRPDGSLVERSLGVNAPSRRGAAARCGADRPHLARVLSESKSRCGHPLFRELRATGRDGEISAHHCGGALPRQADEGGTQPPRRQGRRCVVRCQAARGANRSACSGRCRKLILKERVELLLRQWDREELHCHRIGHGLINS